MMGHLVSRSARPATVILERGARQLLTLMRKKRKKVPTRYDDKESRLPFYEAYVLMLWRGREESFKTSLEPSDVERSEEHTSELQSLMRISYAVFCSKKHK